MKTPFIYGRLAEGSNFTNRDEEARHLLTNFTSGINTVLISPRRWGKTSLVTKTAELGKKDNPDLRFCFLDLYNVRSEQQFYEYLATEVLKSLSGKWEEAMSASKKLLGKLLPQVGFSADPAAEFKLSFDWEQVKRTPEEVLNLAEKMAVDRKIHLVVCIDEFQNIGDFEEPLAVQKRLRAHWQKHQNVTYCLFGSKRHMMMEVFASPSMPFYKFGDIIFLNKIKEDDWVKFITKRFRQTKKKISAKDARHLASLMECHPYYVQQLAQQAWLRTDEKCSREIIDRSHDTLAMQMSMLFQTGTDVLSTTQVNFLKALLSGETKLSSKKVLNQYGLGTSANINKIKQALLNKEAIDMAGGEIQLLDPLYKYWLKKYYFKITS